MVNTKTVAEYCGVSHVTVSNVINKRPGASEETRKRVLAAIDKLNYTPNETARKLKLGESKDGHYIKTFKIGCILDNGTLFSDSYFACLCCGCVKGTQE